MAGVKDKNCELVAKRWALALMELAQEDENVSKEDILDDLHEIADTINSSEELANVINNPSISTEEKQVVLCKLFQNSIMPIVYNFIFVLNLRKRVSIISDRYFFEYENFPVRFASGGSFPADRRCCKR